MALAIEPMRAEDVPQVMEIEREAFSMAWSEGAYRRELRWNKLARYLVLREGLADNPGPEAVPAGGEETRGGLASILRGVFRRHPSTGAADHRVLGYAGMWLMVDEAHLITIAIRREHRRQGLGERLLIAAIDQAMELGARVMTLEVRVSNLAAQALYQKFGFRQVGLRPRYYSDNQEDALVLSSDILTSAPFQHCLQLLRATNSERVGQWEEKAKK